MQQNICSQFVHNIGKFSRPFIGEKVGMSASLFFYLCGGLIMLENKFQSSLIKELRERFPGCVIVKNDPNYIQGIPDLLILWNEKWAALECKKDEKATKRPNQEYYVKTLNNMSFSRFIYPENREGVLDDMEQAFKCGR